MQGTRGYGCEECPVRSGTGNFWYLQGGERQHKEIKKEAGHDIIQISVRKNFTNCHHGLVAGWLSQIERITVSEPGKKNDRYQTLR